MMSLDYDRLDICTMSSSVMYRNRATLNTMQCKMFYRRIETLTERILLNIIVL